MIPKGYEFKCKIKKKMLKVNVPQRCNLPSGGGVDTYFLKQNKEVKCFIVGIKIGKKIEEVIFCVDNALINYQMGRLEDSKGRARGFKLEKKNGKYFPCMDGKVYKLNKKMDRIEISSIDSSRIYKKGDYKFEKYRPSNRKVLLP